MQIRNLPSRKGPSDRHHFSSLYWNTFSQWFGDVAVRVDLVMSVAGHREMERRSACRTVLLSRLHGLLGRHRKGERKVGRGIRVDRALLVGESSWLGSGVG